MQIIIRLLWGLNNLTHVKCLWLCLDNCHWHAKESSVPPPLHVWLHSAFLASTCTIIPFSVSEIPSLLNQTEQNFLIIYFSVMSFSTSKKELQWLQLSFCHIFSNIHSIHHYIHVYLDHVIIVPLFWTIIILNNLSSNTQHNPIALHSFLITQSVFVICTMASFLLNYTQKKESSDKCKC